MLMRGWERCEEGRIIGYDRNSCGVQKGSYNREGKGSRRGGGRGVKMRGQVEGDVIKTIGVYDKKR